MEGNYLVFVDIRGARLGALWKENIAFPGVPENYFVFTIASDSDFKWTLDQLYWKDYLLIFLCI
jgi:hypothetical protein